MEAHKSRASGSFTSQSGLINKVGMGQHGAIFGVSISTAKNRNKNKCDVPTVVDECVKYLETKGLHTEKIFMQSASILQVDKLRKLYDTDKCAFLSKITDPHVVSSLLKLYLSLLPEPLLPWCYFGDEAIPRYDDDEQYHIFVLSKIDKMNTDHKAVLKAISLLLRKLSLQSHVNHMTSAKLAEVFAPLIFSVSPVTQSGISITEYIISHSHAIFNHHQKAHMFNAKASSAITSSTSYASSLSDLSPTYSDGMLTSRSETMASPSESFREDLAESQGGLSSRVIYPVRSSTSLYASFNGSQTLQETIESSRIHRGSVPSNTTYVSATLRKSDNSVNSKAGQPGFGIDLERKSPRNMSKLQSPYPTARPSKEKNPASSRFLESSAPKIGVRRSISLHDTSMSGTPSNSKNTHSTTSHNFCRLVPNATVTSHLEKMPTFHQGNTIGQSHSSQQSQDQESKAGLIGDLTKLIEELKQECDRERKARVDIEERYVALLGSINKKQENIDGLPASYQSSETQTPDW